jgi:AcrR family transcriptional regulator
MSRADTAERIIAAAVAHGTAHGVAALSLQGIAAAAGVSKALVLYHFSEKDRLLAAIAEHLASRDVGVLEEAAGAADALEAWRSVAGDARHRAARALLASLLHEAPMRAAAEAIGARRAAATTRLAAAMLRSAGLRPRIAPALVGRVLLHQLDGLAATGASRAGEALDAELDALALAVLGLGH